MAMLEFLWELLLVKQESGSGMEFIMGNLQFFVVNVTCPNLCDNDTCFNTRYSMLGFQKI